MASSAGSSEKVEQLRRIFSGSVLGPAANDENIAWVKDTHAALGEHLEARRWLNYLGDDQGEDAVRAAYGPNYGRLQELKRRYDPGNVFHHNHNIKP